MLRSALLVVAAAAVAVVAARADDDPEDVPSPTGRGFDLAVHLSDVHLAVLNTTATAESAAEAKILIEEGCLPADGPPVRRLLKFSTTIRNDGDKDLVIGLPPHNRSRVTNKWEWGLSHEHWHYRSYADYVLKSASGAEVGTSRMSARALRRGEILGRKTGFCVMDTGCKRENAEPKYECCNMGITAGCQDTYSSGLACQWIDVTQLDTSRNATDDYTLIVTVNPGNRLGEARMDNNVARVAVNFGDLHARDLFEAQPGNLTAPWPMPYSDESPACKAWIDADDALYPDAPIRRYFPVTNTTRVYGF